MKQKIFVAVLDVAIPFKVRKAKLDVENQLLTFKMGFLKDTTTIIVPVGVGSWPFRRGGRLYLVDPIEHVAVNQGSSQVIIGGVAVGKGQNFGWVSPDLARKIDMMAQTKLWRFIGGRALDTLELLIYLAAGYGVLRFIEYILTSIFNS